MDEVMLREMQVADLPAVIDLWQRTEGMGLDDCDTPEALTAYLHRHPGRSVVAVAEVSGQIVGAVLCGDDGRRGSLHHLAVDRAWRGRGIAQALVDRCMAALASHGIVKCNIFVFADNTDGRGFWAHTGWKHREDLTVMQRLTGAPMPVTG